MVKHVAIDPAPWLHVDPHIRYGYRPQLQNITDCVRSLFYVHNELINIWSHLLPSLYLFYKAVKTSHEILVGGPTTHYSHASTLLLYTLGTALCLLFSAMYHCLNVHSRKTSHRCLKLDYSGIILSMTVSSIASNSRGLVFDAKLMAAYNTMTVIIALSVFYSLYSPQADGYRAKGRRVSLLVALFMTGFIPLAHKMFTDGLQGLDGFLASHIVASTMFYMGGTIFYMTHIPEKCLPGVFDIYGASHQIFHLCVVAGQFTLFFGLQMETPRNERRTLVE